MTNLQASPPSLLASSEETLALKSSPTLSPPPEANGHLHADPHAVPDEMVQRLAKLDDSLGESQSSPKRGSRGVGLLLVLLLLGGGALGAWWYLGRTPEADTRHLEFQPSERGNLLFTIIEKGELEAAKNTEVICRVRASGRGNSIASTIKWVIDNGTRVKRGDLLMQLDDAGIKEQIKNQEIVISSARVTKIQAESTLSIVRSENESALKTAQNNVQLAQLDLEKYSKGELEKLRKDVTGRITLKESELLQSRDRVGWSSRMVKKGYISESQARGDELKLNSSEIELDKLREESRVLNEYDAKRNQIDFQNKLDQAIVAEKVARTQAVAKESEAQAKLQSALAVLNQEETKLEDLREDLRNCRLIAPNDGMVVYYIPESSRFGQGQQQGNIAAGESVREGQKLMRIPDLAHMLVQVKIHETLVPRLRGDVLEATGFDEVVSQLPHVGMPGMEQVVRAMWTPRVQERYSDMAERIAEYGLPASVKVAAVTKPLQGHLKMVSPVASSTDWMSSDVKVYQCSVMIDENVENLKPGMSAEVTVFVDERTNVLKLPVQAVLEAGEKKFCYVQEPGGAIVKRNLHTDLNNNKFVEILPDSDLKEGERVLLNARNYAEKLGDLQNHSSDPNEALASKARGRNGRRNGTSPVAQGTQPTKPQGTRPQGSRPGGTRPAGTRPQMNDAQRAQMEEFNKKMQAASPAERKKMINDLPMPDNVKERIKERMRGQGMQIDD